MQLFLIRHPRPLLAAGVCYGRLDVEAEDPQPIATRLRTLLPTDTPVLASPLRRARCLAEALHRQPLFDWRLQEIDFGEWEGEPWDRLDRGLLDAWASDVLNFVPPGGESPAALQARVLDCIDSLSAESLALVTHAGVIRAILGHWLRLPISEWCQLALDFGSITLLEIETAAADHCRERLAQSAASGILHYINR